MITRFFVKYENRGLIGGSIKPPVWKNIRKPRKTQVKVITKTGFEHGLFKVQGITPLAKFPKIIPLIAE